MVSNKSLGKSKENRPEKTSIGWALVQWFLLSVGFVMNRMFWAYLEVFAFPLLLEGLEDFSPSAVRT